MSEYKNTTQTYHKRLQQTTLNVKTKNNIKAVIEFLEQPWATGSQSNLMSVLSTSEPTSDETIYAQKIRTSRSIRQIDVDNAIIGTLELSRNIARGKEIFKNLTTEEQKMMRLMLTQNVYRHFKKVLPAKTHCVKVKGFYLNVLPLTCYLNNVSPEVLEVDKSMAQKVNLAKDVAKDVLIKISNA